uniref:ParA family protein n=1 Tax=Candidatus Igneacidithiobacillus taiwanensis TaxID=1945924 RepID=UPI00289CC398
HLIISHGEKGGVGKSTFASIVVEAAINSGKKIAVVDADPRSGDVELSDVAARYTNVPDCQAIRLSLAKSGADAADAVSQLFEHVEQIDYDFIVINSPPNSYESLEENAEIIADVAHELGYEIGIGWLLGTEDVSAIMATQSRICQLADKKVAIINRHEGSSDSRFSWFQKPQYRQAWLDSGGMEAEMPELAARVAGAVRDTLSDPAYKGWTMARLASAGSPLPAINRTMLASWLKKCITQCVFPICDFSD